MELQRTFHDLIIDTWKSAKDNLTPKQRLWGDAYLSLFEEKSEEDWTPKDIPTCPQVAKKLGISRAASWKMKKRLLGKLIPYYLEHHKDVELDFDLERAAMVAEESVLKMPEFIEKRRGKNPMYWRPFKYDHKRLGKSFYTGHIGKEISKKDFKKYKNIPIIKRGEHGSSPLSDWWHDKISEYAAEKKISYRKAFDQLWRLYYGKWPEEIPHPYRLCRCCGQLLPLGEVVSGRKITKRIKHCSNRCNTYSKRSRQKTPS